MSKYLYLSRVRPPSGHPQSCMNRQLVLTSGKPRPALPGQQPTSLGAYSFPATAAASNFASVLPGVEGSLSH